MKKNKVDSIHHPEFTQLALDKLVGYLKEYGNDPSKLHVESLRKPLEAYTEMAKGSPIGRVAFGLPTGTGKTLSIVAWHVALQETKEADEISTLIVKRRVEDLCDLKLEMMKRGIPEEKIGLVHSYKVDPVAASVHRQGFASLPSTPDYQDRPILLITEERAKTPGVLSPIKKNEEEPLDFTNHKTIAASKIALFMESIQASFISKEKLNEVVHDQETADICMEVLKLTADLMKNPETSIMIDFDS